MTASTATITVTFGEEKQKTIEITDVKYRNKIEGYSANAYGTDKVSVQVKAIGSTWNINGAGIKKISSNYSNLYPTPHSVIICFGCFGSLSIFSLNHLICTVRVCNSDSLSLPQIVLKM